MDWNSLRLEIEILSIRAKTKIRNGVRLLGLGLVLLGFYNGLIAPIAGTGFFAPHRVFGFFVVGQGHGIVFLGDALIVAVGAVLVWFV